MLQMDSIQFIVPTQHSDLDFYQDRKTRTSTSIQGKFLRKTAAALASAATTRDMQAGSGNSDKLAMATTVQQRAESERNPTHAGLQETTPQDQTQGLSSGTACCKGHTSKTSSGVVLRVDSNDTTTVSDICNANIAAPYTDRLVGMKSSLQRCKSLLQGVT